MADPAGCCSACEDNPKCRSWTTSVQGGPSGGASKCQLKSMSGESQQATKKVGSDSRFTSGYLPAGVHPDAPNGPPGVDPQSLSYESVVVYVLLGVVVLYIGAGLSMSIGATAPMLCAEP
jgi:hypothetical protein